MNDKPIWSPSNITASQMAKFTRYVENKYAVNLPTYEDLHQWSVNYSAEFWESVWQEYSITYSQPYTTVIKNGNAFYNTQWFVGSRLNYAENLLQRRDEHTALVAYLDNGQRTCITYTALYEKVNGLAHHFREQGVTVGDRVAGVVANTIETVIAMLATTSIGAIWSSCSPDFGIPASLDRFSQIQPKLLIAVDGYYYGGKTIDCTDKIAALDEQLAVTQTIIIPLLNSQIGNTLVNHKNIISWQVIMQKKITSELVFEQLPFDHPLFILYSSGTTGKPKCIVHSAGGTLIQHIKEHRLHTNMDDKDVVFYFTTCGWMMWNWLISSLACGSTIVLYDGNPLVTDNALLDLIDKEKISVFGSSAKFFDILEKNNIQANKNHSLDSLKTILSTGSPLVAERFEYIYSSFKKDILLASISGGTDIVSCFLLGNPTLPVYAGKLQSAGLGMEVKIFNEQGESVENKKGELVCTQPFPCCPIGFWDDNDNERFIQAYFSRFPNIWAHGDYVEKTAQGGYIIYGRSDTVLNPGGVRIGTAEIYRQVEKIASVKESIAVGQQWDDDERIILFVVMKDNITLDSTIVDSIRAMIRTNTTPRHMPAKILQVSDIPKTYSGKITEKIVNQIVNYNENKASLNLNQFIMNIDTIQNPESLNAYVNRPELFS
jgi:acetoacetyl-CoA synthetase